MWKDGKRRNRKGKGDGVPRKIFAHEHVFAEDEIGNGKTKTDKDPVRL